MNFAPNDVAEELRLSLRGFLDKNSPTSRVLRCMEFEDGFDEKVWRTAAVDMGLPGLGIDEKWGGSGAGLAEVGVMFEEFGRSLACAPLFASVGLAASYILECDDDAARADLLPKIASGSRATVGWGGHESLKSTVRADTNGSGQWLLSGVADHAIGAAGADLVLIIATTPDGPGLFYVHDFSKVTLKPLVALDLTRPLADIVLSGVVAQRIRATRGDLERAADVAALLLSAEQLGGAAVVLDMAVRYAKDRVQFGRPIGSFQAIKHRCADMLVDVETARSVVWHGLWSADQNPETLAESASLALSVSSDVFVAVATSNIQIHGGIGFSWEHPAHLYLKRAKSSQLTLGHSDRHRARLADLLEIPKGR